MGNPITVVPTSCVNMYSVLCPTKKQFTQFPVIFFVPSVMILHSVLRAFVRDGALLLYCRIIFCHNLFFRRPRESVQHHYPPGYVLEIHEEDLPISGMDWHVLFLSYRKSKQGRILFSMLSYTTHAHTLDTQNLRFHTYGSGHIFTVSTTSHLLCNI